MLQITSLHGRGRDRAEAAAEPEAAAERDLPQSANRINRWRAYFNMRQPKLPGKPSEISIKMPFVARQEAAQGKGGRRRGVCG